jgi:CheY-like chemotaxis protein
MSAPILSVGLDSRGLLLEAPVLRRPGAEVEVQRSGRGLLEALRADPARLVVLGPGVQDLGLNELVQLVRSDPATRGVSILVLLPSTERSETVTSALAAGANAVLRRPLDPQHLERWIVKLLQVPRRADVRVPVRGQVVGVPRAIAGRFSGQSRNLSLNGLLLACPEPLRPEHDVELEVSIDGPYPRLRALGRIVREAGEVAWPYRGYGIEFLLVPPESQEIIANLVSAEARAARPARGEPRIRATVEHESWVYEILDPIRAPSGWQTEIRRGPRASWRPGKAGPFYVVLGGSPEAAYREAKAFVESQD